MLPEYKLFLPPKLSLNDLTSFEEEDEHEIDLLVVVGGDGTILWSLLHFKSRVPPPILAFGKVNNSLNQYFNRELLDIFAISISRTIENP